MSQTHHKLAGQIGGLHLHLYGALSSAEIARSRSPAARRRSAATR